MSNQIAYVRVRIDSAGAVDVYCEINGDVNVPKLIGLDQFKVSVPLGNEAAERAVLRLFLEAQFQLLSDSGWNFTPRNPTFSSCEVSNSMDCWIR
jgi:hypothetical protein